MSFGIAFFNGQNNPVISNAFVHPRLWRKLTHADFTNVNPFGAYGYITGAYGYQFVADDFPIAAVGTYSPIIFVHSTTTGRWFKVAESVVKYATYTRIMIDIVSNVSANFDVYIFYDKPPAPSSGWGFKLKNSSGVVTFDSTVNHLRVKKVQAVNIANYPVDLDITGLSKPAFCSLLRGFRTDAPTQYVGTSDGVTYYLLTTHFSVVNLYSSTVLRQQWFDFTTAYGVPSNSGWNYFSQTRIPTTSKLLMVIDGAEYD